MSDTEDFLVGNLPADPDYAAAIGQICLTWNQIEDLLAFLIVRYFSHDEQLATAVMSVTGNQSRIDLLAHLVETKEKQPDYAERVRYFIKAFNICKENRNIAVHSSIRLKSPSEKWLEKPSKSAVSKTVRYSYSLPEMERVSLDLRNLLGFGVVLMIRGLINELLKRRPMEGRKPGALPDIPPLPRKLTPLLPPDQSGGIPPPQASAD